jgi:hypothetical protein
MSFREKAGKKITEGGARWDEIMQMSMVEILIQYMAKRYGRSN